MQRDGAGVWGKAMQWLTGAGVIAALMLLQRVTTIITEPNQGLVTQMRQASEATQTTAVMLGRLTDRIERMEREIAELRSERGRR